MRARDPRGKTPRRRKARRQSAPTAPTPVVLEDLEQVDRPGSLVSLLRGQRNLNGASFTETPFIEYLQRAEQFHQEAAEGKIAHAAREDLVQIELELEKHGLSILHLFAFTEIRWRIQELATWKALPAPPGRRPRADVTRALNAQIEIFNSEHSTPEERGTAQTAIARLRRLLDRHVGALMVAPQVGVNPFARFTRAGMQARGRARSQRGLPPGAARLHPGARHSDVANWPR